MSSCARVLLAALAALAVSGASAADAASSLPEKIAANLNDLARAAYACGAGALSLGTHFPFTEPGFPPILGVPDYPTPDGDVLKLTGTTLKGAGGTIRTDDKLNVFKFTCTLRPDLTQALTFTMSDALVVPPRSAKANSDADDRNPDFFPAGAKPVWSVNTDGNDATLRHGVEELARYDFFASCAPGSGQMVWEIPIVPSNMKVSDTTTVSAFFKMEPGRLGMYVGRAFKAASGKLHLRAEVAANDPMLRWMQTADEVSVSSFGARVDISFDGASEAAKTFASTCAKA